MTRKTFYRTDGTKVSFSTEIPEVGSLRRKETFRGISYIGIKPSQEINICGTLHTISIENYSVLIDSCIIVTAPGHMKPAKAKTFCNAVVWALLNDEENMKDHLMRIPSPVQQSRIEEPASMAITSYPENGPELLEKIETAEMCKNTDLIRALEELNEFSPSDEGRDIPEYENFELSEYWPGVMKEVVEKGLDKPRGWIPHLRVCIEEVPA